MNFLKRVALLPFWENCAKMAKKGRGRRRTVDKKKAAAVAAVTTAAAASMVTGALFDSPADLLNQPEPDDIVEFMDEDG